MGNDLVLEMKGIYKTFGGVKALDNVDFTLSKGEVHALVGENGAGKSTLIKILAGVYHKDSGTILIEDEEVNIGNAHVAQQLGLNFIFQELDVVPNFTVLENIFLGREPTKHGLLNWKGARSTIEKIITDCGVEIDLDVLVRDLSVPERQKVMIVKALATNARVVVMDEPTQALSQVERKNLFAIIRKLKGQGVSIIYISHYLEEIFEMADSVTVLRDGLSISTKSVQDVSPREIVTLMIGKKVDGEHHKERKDETRGEERFSVKGVTRRGVLHDIGLSLKQGEILGLVGSIGAGKTELARILFGLDPMDSGSIELDKKKIAIRSPQKSIEAGVCLLPEDRRNEGLFMAMGVKDNASIAGLGQWCRAGGYIIRSEEKRAIKSIVERLQVKYKNYEEYVKYLSGGNQQKVVLAKWLLVNTKVFILDEPLRGIDVGVKAEIRHIIRDIAEKGVSIIYISSESPTKELLELWDRVVVMYKGAVTARFKAKDTNQEELLYYIMGGKDSGNKKDGGESI